MPENAFLAGWRHASGVLPAALTVGLLARLRPDSIGLVALAMLGGVLLMRPVSFARIGGVALGVCTGLAIVFAGLWVLVSVVSF